MSLGNLNTQGDKKNNFAYQLATVKLLDAILAAIVASGAGAREFRITTYQAIANGPGFSIGDIISRTDIIDVVTGVIISTLWFNETTGLTIAAPLITSLVPYSPAPASSVRTPSLTRVVAAGTVAAGARSVSVYNAGTTAGTWLGAAIEPGEQFAYDAGGNDVLSAFAYTASATAILVITTII